MSEFFLYLGMAPKVADRLGCHFSCFRATRFYHIRWRQFDDKDDAQRDQDNVVKIAQDRHEVRNEINWTHGVRCDCEQPNDYGGYSGLAPQNNRQRIMLNAFCRSSQPAKDHGRHLTTSCAIGITRNSQG